jgi:hypothetical protein
MLEAPEFFGFSTLSKKHMFRIERGKGVSIFALVCNGAFLIWAIFMWVTNLIGSMKDALIILSLTLLPIINIATIIILSNWVGGKGSAERAPDEQKATEETTKGAPDEETAQETGEEETA